MIFLSFYRPQMNFKMGKAKNFKKKADIPQYLCNVISLFRFQAGEQFIIKYA